MKRVSVVAIFHAGKLLMGVRRKEQKWTNPGGHLEENEEPIDGARREADEESGIKLEEKDLKLVNHETVTKPDGTKIEVFAYRADLKNRPATTMRNDPDVEVQRWHWIDVSRGALPKNVESNLHVPFKDNVLMKGLHMEKAAFWNGFEKRAEESKLAFVPLTLGGVAKGVATGGYQMAKDWAKANPKKALGLGAAGAGVAGFAAGRASAPSGPRYPY